MIVVKLRAAMESFRHRTGERLTSETLADKAGVSKATVEALSSRPAYNTTLATLEKLCRALGCGPGDLLELLPDPPQLSPRRRAARPSRRSRPRTTS